MKSPRQTVFRKLALLYDEMAASYAAAAERLGMSCEGCTRNCCTSFFQHHTYIEWAYLWKGISELPEERQARIIDQANAYTQGAAMALSFGRTPAMMCPLNVDGRCGLYAHRLMICRMHGVPNTVAHPSGRTLAFPGCWKSQELTAALPEGSVAAIDRTPFYHKLAGLERELLGQRFGRMPKVDLTLADMILMGAPRL